MSFMPEPAAEVRQTEVESAFARVDEITAYIDKCVEELENTLGRSILAQRKPEANGNATTSTPEPVRVPLAQSLF